MCRVLFSALLVTFISVPGHAAEAELKPAGLINYASPRFPTGLRGNMAGDGQVVVAFTIGAEGKVLDSVALEATRTEFVEAVTTAVNQWLFTPTTQNPPMPRREVIQFDFKRNGVVTTLQHAEAAQQAFISTPQAQFRTVPLNQLDAEPKRLTAKMPNVSVAQLNKQGTTPLMINFVIDTEGSVRVPVVTAVDAALAQSVLEAVKQWRYTPPVQKGVPVLVEMTRSLVLPTK